MNTSQAPGNLVPNLIVALQLISHYAHTPSWLNFYVGLVIFYSVLIAYRGQVASSSITRVLIAMISMAVFFLYYRSHYTVDMAVSFLLLSSSLKLLEMRSKKDRVIFAYIMLYLSAVSFLFDQSFLHTLLQLVLLMLCFYLLLRQNGAENLGLLRTQWSALLKIVLYAAPLVIVSFLFFPRLAPLWSIPIKTQHATTGMSDSMSPGDIAELSLSSERAFRVSFSEQIPPPQQRYWRGLVLDHFDGRTWRRSQTDTQLINTRKIDPGIFFGGSSDSYEVMLEPHNQQWVFALEASRVSSSNLIEGDMGLFQLKTEAIQPTHFKFRTVEHRQFNETEKTLPPTAFKLRDKKRVYSRPKMDLQVPAASNPRTRQFVRSLLRQNPDRVAFINTLMQRFQQQPYFYTLKPPALGANFVDEFLFDSLRGFCAHYAGSLAYMLRLAQIPARVVIGYQGGEVNEQADYLIVHQYDAHAWVEASIPEHGWVRLDPTAMVAPSRILQGLEQAVSDEDTFLEGSPLASVALKIGLFNWMRLRMDELNYQWQKWVVNYNSSEQNSLMSDLFGQLFSHNSLARVASIFAATFLVVFVGMSWYLWRLAVPSKYSKAAKRYIAWLYLLRRFGFKRVRGETPRAFLRRVEAGTYPRLAQITRNRTKALEEADYH